MRTKAEVESWKCKIEESPRQEALKSEELLLRIFSRTKTKWIDGRDIVDGGRRRKRSSGPGASELILLSYQKRQGGQVIVRSREISGKRSVSNRKVMNRLTWSRVTSRGRISCRVHSTLLDVASARCLSRIELNNLEGPR